MTKRHLIVEIDSGINRCKGCDMEDADEAPDWCNQFGAYRSKDARGRYLRLDACRKAEERAREREAQTAYGQAAELVANALTLEASTFDMGSTISFTIDGIVSREMAPPPDALPRGPLPECVKQWQEWAGKEVARSMMWGMHNACTDLHSAAAKVLDWAAKLGAADAGRSKP